MFSQHFLSITKMKNIIFILSLVAMLVFFPLCKCFFNSNKEGFRRRGHRRGEFWDGPQAYLNRFRRRDAWRRPRNAWRRPRNSWRGPIDYDYEDYGEDYERRDYGPRQSWYGQNFFNDYWWPPVNAFWSVPLQCKKGCTPNGCATPGNGPNDCVWSSDCNGC